MNASFTRLYTDVSVENPGTATQTIRATPFIPTSSTACVDGSTWSATGTDPCTPCSVCQSPLITNQQCTATSNTTCTRPAPHPSDCNPLSMDDSVPPQYIHNINNPSDSWGACTNHPAFTHELLTKCDQRCSVPDNIDDCRQCITDNIGSFWDPFDQCSLLEIGEENGDLKNVCNAPGNTYVGRKEWNYQLVPETSEYQCTDACTN